MNLKKNTFRILDSLQDYWPFPLVILSHSKVGEWESHSPAGSTICGMDVVLIHVMQRSPD